MSYGQDAAAPAGNEQAGTSEVLLPTYWGSLFALGLGVVYTIVASVRSGPPSHVLSLDEGGLSLPIFYGALLFVSLFTFRYYCAVCVNIYGQSSDAVFRLPEGAPRIIGFSLLCVLVTLAVSSVGAVIALGVVAALFICRIMAVISLIMFCASWLLYRENRRKYHSVPTAFGLGDAALLALTWWSLASIAGGPTDITVVGFFVSIAVMGILVAVEFRRRYWRVFREQMGTLLSKLSQ